MNRLQQRVERHETGKVAKRGPVVIVVEEDESAEAAKAEYFARHPEDREATDIIIVQIVDPTVRD